MEDSSTTLNYLPIGKKGKIKKILLNGLMKRRLLDLGMIDDTLIEPLYKSPFGDPIAYFIRGTVIALRSDITTQIVIERV